MKQGIVRAFKKSTMLILSILFAVLLCISAPLFSRQASAVADVSGVEVQSYYSVGAIFDTPTVEGYKTVIISPSKKVYDSNKLSLNETGVWTLRFENNSGFEEKTFTVYNNRYDVSSLENATEYTTSSVFPNSGKGLVVTLEPNKTFKYNEVIDLTNLTAAENILEFGFITGSSGTADLTELDIYLTDIYDTNNYIKIIVRNPNNTKAGNYKNAGSLRATFSGQTAAIGCDVVSEQGVISLHSNGEDYGSYTSLDFYGVNEQTTKISYDYQDKTVHSNSKKWYSYANKFYNSKWQTGVIDLDDLDYANNYTFSSMSSDKIGFTEPFKGFSTGEVYLSIEGKGFTSASTKLFIKSIIDADFAETDSFDKHSPYLTVDNPYGDDLPQGEVNKAYPLFDSHVVDNELEDISVDREVFMTFSGARMYSVPVINGAFTPDRVGTYEIVYSATDGYLNKTEKSYFVEVVNNVANPTVSFDVEGANSCYVGNEVQLSTVTTSSSTGEATVRNEVLFDSKVIASDVESFTPQSAGTYTVKYYAYDYIGQYSTISYEISASVGAPVIVGEPSLPYGIIAGKTYSFPVATALDYSNLVGGKPCEVSAKVYVTDDTGRKLVEGGYTLNASSSLNSVLVEYVFESATSADTVYQKQVPVAKISDYAKDLYKYFIGDATATQTENGVDLIFSGDGSVRFINKVLAEDFLFSYAIKKDGDVMLSNASQVNLFLKDSADASKVVKLSVKRNDDLTSTNSFVCVNDGRALSVNASFYSETNFEIYYENSLKTFTVAGVDFTVDNYLNGEEFEGFTSNAVLIEVEAVGVDSTAQFGFTVQKINNQSLKNVKGDKIAAEVFYTQTRLYKYECGITVQSIPVAIVDVLQPTSTATIRVVSPSGKIVSDVNGLQLNGVDATVAYSFKLEEYGNYRLRYTFDEGTSWEESKTVNMDVADNVAPTVSTDKTEVTCKLGELVTLPTLTLSDNIDAAEDIVAHAICFNPDSIVSMAKITTEDDKVTASYTFDKEGEWAVCYMIYDSSYNYTVINIKVIVRK